MTACPERLLMLNALVDGELDAGHALELENHVAACHGCADELAALRAVRAALAAPGLAYEPPLGFRERALAALTAEEARAAPPRRRAPAGWLAGGSIAAVAASLALLAVMAPVETAVQAELVEGHIRSLQAPQHLVDVATSDRHTVKPWFNGKIDFAPPVVDLAAQGYPLTGGRLDRVDGRRAAALVFRRRAHAINLFIWPGEAPASPLVERKQGYSLVRWG